MQTTQSLHYLLDDIFDELDKASYIILHGTVINDSKPGTGKPRVKVLSADGHESWVTFNNWLSFLCGNVIADLILEQKTLEPADKAHLFRLSLHRAWRLARTTSGLSIDKEPSGKTEEYEPGYFRRAECYIDNTLITDPALRYHAILQARKYSAMWQHSIKALTERLFALSCLTDPNLPTGSPYADAASRLNLQSGDSDTQLSETLEKTKFQTKLFFATSTSNLYRFVKGFSHNPKQHQYPQLQSKPQTPNAKPQTPNTSPLTPNLITKITNWLKRA